MVTVSKGVWVTEEEDSSFLTLTLTLIGFHPEILFFPPPQWGKL